MKVPLLTVFSLRGATAPAPYQCPRCGGGGAPPRSLSWTLSHRWFLNPVVNPKSCEDTTKNQTATPEWHSALAQKSALPSTPAPASAEQRVAPHAGPYRVLIADDDAVVRGSLAAVLESESFVVNEARSGMEAVACAIEHLPDLVLLDLNMPNWDGWTAFSQLDRVTPLLPVIVITARPNQYEKAVRLGVDAFMEKPLNIPVLVRAIKRLASEDKDRHVHRVTNRAFVTRLLGSADPDGQQSGPPFSGGKK